MASLYEQLMASKGAPKAAAASNSTQLRKAPMSLRSAMRKYAEGGDVNSFSGEEGRSNQSLSFPQLSDPDEVRPLQGGNLGAGLAQAVQGIQGGRLQGNDFTQALMDIAKQAQAQNQQDIQQPRFPERVRPPEPRYPDTAPPRPEEVRPPEPRYEEPRYPEMETKRPPEPRYEESRPQTSYRQEADGTMTEIGFDGMPVSGYTSEQMADYNKMRGIGEPEFRYVWNGQGYDKLPNGPQIGYGPGPTTAPMPDYGQTTAPYPDTASMPMFPDTAPDPYTARMPNYDIGYDSGVAPTKDPREEPRYYEPDPEPIYEPMPEPQYYEPELPPEPQYYQPPEIYPQVGPQTGYNENPQRDPRSSPNQQSEGLSALIAKLLAGGGGGSSLEEQRKLMSLLEMLKGK